MANEQAVHIPAGVGVIPAPGTKFVPLAAHPAPPSLPPGLVETGVPYVIVARKEAVIVRGDDEALAKARELVRDTGQPHIVARVITVIIERKTVQAVSL